MPLHQPLRLFLRHLGRHQPIPRLRLVRQELLHPLIYQPARGDHRQARIYTRRR